MDNRDLGLGDFDDRRSRAPPVCGVSLVRFARRGPAGAEIGGWIQVQTACFDSELNLELLGSGDDNRGGPKSPLNRNHVS